MEKTDDLISWVIMNSPVPLASERPQPTPLFDMFSGHMRAIVERIVTEWVSEDLPTRVEGWDWDAYAQAFRVTTVTTFLGPIVKVTGSFELRLEGHDEWREAFEAFKAEIDAYAVEIAKIDASMKARARALRPRRKR